PRGLPDPRGLYDPSFEHDACGVGFVAHVGGAASHDIVSRAIEALVRLGHRGGAGADPDSGDGAGIMIQIPDAVLREEASRSTIALPARGAYAVGSIFLSRDDAARAMQVAALEQAATARGLRVLGWRDVPIEPDKTGRLARASLPCIRQILLGAPEG